MFALWKFDITPSYDIAQYSKIGFAKVLLRINPIAELMQAASFRFKSHDNCNLY